ncbi:MAG: ABC transporter ATP-binding protein, partial [Rhodospirillaceae bacterium]|nr:ABC transporter ATP-binding protein [Rhodospirillaceae bacterium]
MQGLHMVGVRHAYGRTQVLNDISLTVPAGELVCLLGPSGCGKTTLLRIAAGMERLQGGSVTIDEQVVAAPNVQVPPEERQIGFMFQDYALFPHLSVFDNVAFGLFRLDQGAARTRAMEVLEQVGMTPHADKHPHLLSGGQQQRVALARSLAPKPRLVLL